MPLTDLPALDAGHYSSYPYGLGVAFIHIEGLKKRQMVPSLFVSFPGVS